MLKKILFILDKPLKDEVFERIEKEPVVNKSWNYLGGVFLCILCAFIALLITIIRLWTPYIPYVYGVNIVNGAINTNKVIKMYTLPYAQQSAKSLSYWLMDAIEISYSFDFLNFDQQKNRAAFYFTDDGYKSYLFALESNKIEQTVKEKKLEISIISTKDPIWLGEEGFGENYMWKYRVPVLITYNGGKNPIVQSYVVDITIIRVPSYKNHKGLAISQFTIKSM